MVTEKLVDSYLTSGISAYTAGDFQTAGKMFFAAYQKSKNYSKSDPRLAYVYTNLSLFYFQQKRYKKCENLLQQALQILSRAGQFNTPLAENVRTQLANVFFLQNKSMELLALYKDCLKEFQQEGIYLEASNTYDRIVELYCALNKHRSAETWCKLAIEYDKALHKEHEQASKKRWVRLAWIYTQQGRSHDACQAYQKSVETQAAQHVQTTFPQANVHMTYAAL